MFIPVMGNRVVIQNFSDKYGFEKNIVNCMCMYQDTRGFLWFGMANGLYKFDLNAFTHISLQRNRINGFPESDIRAIIEYAPGLLLVGTYNKGLLLYNTISEHFETIQCSSPIDFSKLFVHSLYKDRSGAIWVGTFNGLFQLQFRGNENKFELVARFDKTNSNLISSEFVDIRESSSGVVWFITMSDIGYYNASTKRIKTFTTYNSNSSFTFLDDHRILIGCFGSGLKSFDTQTLQLKALKLEGIADKSLIRYVYKDSQSNIWLSISNVGLILIESGIEHPKLTFISNKESEYSNLNSNVIYQIGESKDGALWACSEEGINMVYLKKDFFHSFTCKTPEYNTSISLGVRSLLNSGCGFIWTGTIGGGLKQFDLKTNKFTDVPIIHKGKPIGKNIQVILGDHKGNIWLGTEGEGVIKFSVNKNSGSKPVNTINYRIYPESFPAKTLLNDYIMCLLEDRHRNIWIGTWHGLSLIDSSELEKRDPSAVVIRNFLHDPSDDSSISNNTIMSLREDKYGNIWAGTQEGINKIVKTARGYRFQHNFKSKNGTSLSEKKILVIYESNMGKLWFSTQDGGIALLDKEKKSFEEYNSDNGFHDNIINSISEDLGGNLWLGTTNGLCRFDQSSRSFKNFTTEDGLSSNIFLFASNCIDNNNLYFGGNYGITVFDPKQIVSSTFKPNLVITDFKLFNKPVLINQKGSPLKQHISSINSITLNYNQNFITIAFAALNYKQHQEVLYSCILEGLESSWNNLGKEHKITYTNLSAGNYLFRARAYGSNNCNNSADICLHIVVRPPFWKTLWAYMVYIGLIIFVLIQTYRFFLNREKQRNALALERLNAKRIHEMDLMRLRFFTNISHEFRTPLTLLSAPLESLINEENNTEKNQSYYKLMLKNVRRLARLIDQLLDLRKIEEGYQKMEWFQGDIVEFIEKTANSFLNYAEKRQIYYTFRAGTAQLTTFFDADKLDKVLFNLLSNAFKYTPDNGTISLSLEVKSGKEIPYPGTNEKYLEIKLSDSGFGISKEAILKIFDPFQQDSRTKPIDSGATGIGLALTKELVNLHHGFISVESEVGKGSIFTVYLPLYEINPQTDLPVNEIRTTTNMEVSEVTIDTNVPSGNSKVSLTPSMPLILIVEDNPDLRTFLRDELQNSYRVLESCNGKEGLTTAFSKIPDLILSDIMMDQMDGLEMCKILKADERTSHIPVILLTARYSEDIKLNSYEIGADEYIIKPFNMALLNARIRNLLEQRRKLRKLFGNGNNFDVSAIVSNKVDSQFMEKLLLVIEKNIDNPNFDPSMLASDMAMSRMQLYRKVTALTNQTVYSFIRTVRLNRAAHLLLTSDMQISEIAVAVGYPEPSNFTRSFIRQFNQTPSQYVRSQRKSIS
jgi:Signal transduction histidine kinase